MDLNRRSVSYWITQCSVQSCWNSVRKSKTSGRFPVVYAESKSRDLIKCLGREYGSVGGVISEQTHYGFLDEVAQETRTQLERVQKWSHIIGSRMARSRSRQEWGRCLDLVFQKLLGFTPSQEQARVTDTHSISRPLPQFHLCCAVILGQVLCSVFGL